jgi:hypothetical protein
MTVERDVGVVIVAGGLGTRTGQSELKQFRWVAGKPMLLHSLQAFHARADVAMVVCVIPRAYVGDPPPWILQCDVDRLLVSVGGATRSESVMKLPSGLPYVSSNGIVAGDSDNTSIRIVSNLNGMPDSANGYSEDSDVVDTDEDVKFLMYVDADLGQRYIVRYEKNGTKQTTVLANRIDSLIFRYFDEKVTYDTTVVDGVCDITNVKNAAGVTEDPVSPGAAKFVVIAVGLSLPAVGQVGAEGYQPPSQVQLTSDVVLRNSIVY